MDNFDLKKFLTENKLTKTSILREGLGAYEFEEGKEEGKAEEKKTMSKKAFKQKIKEMILAELSLAEGEEEIVDDTDAFLKEAKKKKKEKEAPEEEELDFDLGEKTPEGEENLDINFGAEDTAPAEDNFNIDTSAVDPNIKAVQDALTQAQKVAQKTGDDKLVTQINNTITMFTRDHIANKEPIANEVPEPIREYFDDDENYDEGANNQYVTNGEDGWELNTYRIKKYVENTSDDSDFANDFAYSDTLEDEMETADDIKNLTNREVEKMINNAMYIFIEENKPDLPSSYYTDY